MNKLIVLLIALLFSVNGFAVNGCVNPFAFSFMSAFSPADCAADFPERSDARFCECLEKKSENNFIVRDVLQDFDALKEHNKQERQKYIERWGNVYKDNIYASAYQQRILYEDQNFELPTCNPAKVSKQIKVAGEAYLKEERKRLLDSVTKLEAEQRGKGCLVREPNKDCQELNRRIFQIKEKLAKPLQDKMAELCDASTDGITTMTEKIAQAAEQRGLPFGTPRNEEKKKSYETQIQEMIDWHKKRGNTTEVKKLETTLANVKKVLEQDLQSNVPKNADNTPATEIKVGNGTNPTWEFYAPNGSQIVNKIPVYDIKSVQNIFSTCDRNKQDEAMKYLVDAYADFEIAKMREKLQDSSYMGDDQDEKKECDANDKICSSIENLNKKLSDKVGENMKRNDSCYSYAQFLMLQGVPGQELANAFRNKSESEIAALLDPPVVGTSSLDQERLSFLRANPIISKLTNNHELKQKLATSLKQMSQNLKGTDAQRLDAYLGFMKGDLKRLLATNSAKVAVAKNCDDLANQHTGILVADHFPVPKRDNPDMYERVLDCQIKSSKNDAVTDIEVTMARNRMSLINGDRSILEDSKNSLHDYKAFTDANCKDFDKHKAANCPNGVTPECRASYGGTKDVNDVFKKNEVKTDITPKDTSAVVAMTQGRNDNKKFEQWYDRNLRQRQKPTPIAFNGQANGYGDDLARNDEIVDQANVPTQFNTSPSTAADNTAPSSGKAESTTPPSWLKELPPMEDAPLTLNDVENASNVNDLLSQDPTKTYQERELERQALSEELRKLQEEAELLNNDQEKHVDERIKTFQQQLVKQKQNDEVQMAKDQAPVQAVPPQSYLASGAGGGVMGQGAVNTGGGAGSVARSSGRKASSQEAYNKVVLTMYDARKEVTMPSGLKVQDIPANPDVLNLSLSVEQLYPSKEEFDAFVKEEEGQNKLALFLYQKLPQPYKNQVVTLVHPVTKEVMRVHVFKDGKSFTARPFQRKFKRSAVEGFFKQAL